MEPLNRFASRVLFLVALLCAALAAWAKLASLVGLRLRFLPHITPSRLLEIGVMIVLFVIVFELREIKHLVGSDRSESQ